MLFDDLVEHQLSIKVSKKLHQKFNFDFLIINEKGYSPASEIFNQFLKKKKKLSNGFPVLMMKGLFLRNIILKINFHTPFHSIKKHGKSNFN